MVEHMYMLTHRCAGTIRVFRPKKGRFLWIGEGKTFTTCITRCTPGRTVM
jgi:hypothetical protein